MSVKIESSWREALKDQFNKEYFKQIVLHIRTEREQGKIIFPKGNNIFKAFDATPLNKVKVVIIGQDPYHGAGQANGLCFSVNRGVSAPPSLQNIFKELQRDIGLKIPSHGDLLKWAEQGVFLLNASLTVRSGEPMSHAQIGWATFTDSVIKTISAKRDKVVFLLWGKFAKEKMQLIDPNKHYLLTAPHPSPLSAHQGFIGCGHFSSCNMYLVKNGIDPIDWQLD